MSDVEESCGNCRFYKLFEDGKGWCRRNPPQVIVSTARVYEKSGNIDIYHATMNPTMYSREWCGEWHYKNATK